MSWDSFAFPEHVLVLLIILQAIALKKCQLLSHVWFFVIPWTIACQALLSLNSLGKNTGVGRHFLLQGIFLNQGLNLGLQHCRQILYCLSHSSQYWTPPCPSKSNWNVTSTGKSSNTITPSHLAKFITYFFMPSWSFIHIHSGAFIT